MTMNWVFCQIETKGIFPLTYFLFRKPAETMETELVVLGTCVNFCNDELLIYTAEMYLKVEELVK
jgi:hypothetical protein